MRRPAATAAVGLAHAPAGELEAPRRHKDKSTDPTRAVDFPQEVGRPFKERARQLRARKDAHFPSHVRACVNNDLPGPVWSVAVWRKVCPLEQTRIPYACGSYRCTSPECQKHAASSDFVRIKEALERQLPLTPAQFSRVVRALRGVPKAERKERYEEARAQAQARGWVFLVLTLDRNGRYSGARPWHDEQEAFGDLQRLSQGFFRNLREHQEARGWRVTKNEWVAVVESHLAGWPHVNFLVYSPELAEELRRDSETLSELGVNARGLMLVRGELARIVTKPTSMGRKESVRVVDQETGEVTYELRTVRAGWGIQSTAEPAGNQEALAGYVVKLGATHDDTVGEVAKLTQVPSNAKMKLRRIRAGKLFLPKRLKNEEYTGAMVKRSRTREGDYDVDLAVEPERVKVKLTDAERTELRAQARAFLLLELKARGLLEQEAFEPELAEELEELEREELERLELELTEERRAAYILGAQFAVRHELALYLEEEREAAKLAHGARGELEIANRHLPLRYGMAADGGFTRKRETSEPADEPREAPAELSAEDKRERLEAVEWWRAALVAHGSGRPLVLDGFTQGPKAKPANELRPAEFETPPKLVESS